MGKRGTGKFIIGGLIGGYCTGVYSYDSLSLEMLRQLQNQNISKEILGLIYMVQYGILFGLLLAIIGIFISKKINLWKDFKITKKAVITTIIITIISALILFPLDKLVFGSFNTWVAEQYTVKPSIFKIIGGLLVGGIIEEVIVRLFFIPESRSENQQHCVDFQTTDEHQERHHPLGHHAEFGECRGRTCRFVTRSHIA